MCYHRQPEGAAVVMTLNKWRQDFVIHFTFTKQELNSDVYKLLSGHEINL